MKEKIANLVAEGIDEALQELMPLLDGKFSKADERMLERVNLAAEKIRAIEKGLPNAEAIREAVYGALKGQLSNLNLDVDTVKARVDALRELKDGDAGRDGKDGMDGRDGKDGTFGKDGLDGRDGQQGKDARDGKDGLDGRDGRDATFRAAVAWEQGKEFGHGTVATHRNGVWYAERTTDTEPSAEASGWILLAEGLHDIETVWDHEEDIRNFKMYISLASGETIIHEMRVPFTQYREVWTDGEEYTSQDMVTQNGSIWMSLRDSNNTKPGTDAGVGFWKLAVKRGADGKDGRRGEKGPIGLEGEKGAPGSDGKHGKDATDGIDGKDGARGPKGSAGKDGTDGEKGVSGNDGREGDLFVDADIDMELRQVKFIKDDGTYVGIPLVKMSQAMEKAMSWRGAYKLGEEYKAGDLVRVGTGRVVICLKDTSNAPAPYADGVRNQEEWDVFVWIDSAGGSGGGGGAPPEPADMWVMSEGLDIDSTLGATISEAINNLPTPLLIEENQATIFGYNNDKYFYTANQREHSVGIGGNYVTTMADFYTLTQEGLTEITQQRISVEDTGDELFLDRFNNYVWPNYPTTGLHLVRWEAFYIRDEKTDDVYVWQGPKDVRVGANGDYVALDDDLKWISKGHLEQEGGVQAPIEQPAHGFALMDCVYWNGTAWAHAMADDDTTMALGVVTGVDDDDNFKYSSIGRYFMPAHGITADEWYFLSDTIPGGLTRIEPENSQPIVYAETADWISVFPYRPSAEQIQSVGEAPEDGQQYIRQDGAWEVSTSGADGVPEAPIDGTPYSRQDEGWIPAAGGGGSELVLEYIPQEDLIVGAAYALVVGGPNFPTIDSAFEWAMQHPTVGWNTALSYPQLIISVPEGVHAVTGQTMLIAAASGWKMDIQGVGSALSIIDMTGAAGFQILQNLTISEVTIIDSLIVLDGGSTLSIYGDTVLTECKFAVGEGCALDIQASTDLNLSTIKAMSVHAGGGVHIAGDIVFADVFSDAIETRGGSWTCTGNVSINSPDLTNPTVLVDGILSIGGNLDIVGGDPAVPSIIITAPGASASIGGAITFGGSAAANIPLNEIQADGRVVFEGATGTPISGGGVQSETVTNMEVVTVLPITPDPAILYILVEA